MSDQKIIQHLDELLRIRSHPIWAVLYMRESSTPQMASQNLRNRLKNLYRHVKELGCVEIIGQRHCIEDSRQLIDRPMLKSAIREARIVQEESPEATVLVLTDTRNRFLRGSHFNGYESTDTPAEWQWNRLRKMAKGVILATILLPDATFNDVRTFEMDVAKQYGKQIGRPRKKAKPKPGIKKEKRERLLAMVKIMRRKGASFGDISKRLGVAKSTLWEWVKKWG